MCWRLWPQRGWAEQDWGVSGRFHQGVSRWFQAKQAPGQPRRRGRGGELLPAVLMQNKYTKKWHMQRKITVCFKARKIVVKAYLQRNTWISLTRHYFLCSAQLAGIILCFLKAHRFLGQWVRKQTCKRASDTSFFCCQLRDIQNQGKRSIRILWIISICSQHNPKESFFMETSSPTGAAAFLRVVV